MNGRHADLLDKYYTLATKESSEGLLSYLKYVKVDAQPDKKPFRTIAEPWQWERERRVAGAIDNLAGIATGYGGPKSFWHGYHKGSDKTHSDARRLCFLLGWSKRAVRCYAVAGSHEQAKLIVKAMENTVRDNRWIGERVQVYKEQAVGVSGSTLEVLGMDAYTGQGIFPDYVIAEEVTHWQYDMGERFWDFVMSSVNKRPDCVLEVNTNAGHVGSWQQRERDRVSRSKFWSFYEAPVGDPLPSWMNREKIADDSQGMSPGERDRLYKNRWVDPGEEYGFLTRSEAEACVDPSLQEQSVGRKNLEYWAVIDYGGVIDRCALCVMHAVPGTDTAVIDRLDCWQGSHDARIDINVNPSDPDGRSVEGWLLRASRNFRLAGIVVDPYQLEGLAIVFERRGYWVNRFEYRSGKGNHRMAQALRNAVRNRKVTWSQWAGHLPGAEDDTLPKELSRLIMKDTAFGYRFDHTSGRHDDRATAIGMGLVHVLPEAPPAGSQGPTVVTPDSQPSPQEILERFDRPPSERPQGGLYRDWASQAGLWGAGQDNDTFR